MYKALWFQNFSNKLFKRSNLYYSFFVDISCEEELDFLFKRISNSVGLNHFPIYRLCDAEYMYLFGRKRPFYKLSIFNALKFILKTQLIKIGLTNQFTWHGEGYNRSEIKLTQRQLLVHIKEIGDTGYLAPHLLKSESRFCEEFNDHMLHYFEVNNVKFDSSSYFPFYFVYAILTIKKFRQRLFENRNILIVTAFNREKNIENFERGFSNEGVKSLFFYEISATKSLLTVIDVNQLPKEKIDIVLIGAGIGSANIMQQLKHLDAVCIDAGHALDCFANPLLRKERICLIDELDSTHICLDN